jgi:hypothetical protein
MGWIQMNRTRMVLGAAVAATTFAGSLLGGIGTAFAEEAVPAETTEATEATDAAADAAADDAATEQDAALDETSEAGSVSTLAAAAITSLNPSSYSPGASVTVSFSGFPAEQVGVGVCAVPAINGIDECPTLGGPSYQFSSGPSGSAAVVAPASIKTGDGRTVDCTKSGACQFVVGTVSGSAVAVQPVSFAAASPTPTPSPSASAPSGSTDSAAAATSASGGKEGGTLPDTGAPATGTLLAVGLGALLLGSALVFGGRLRRGTLS